MVEDIPKKGSLHYMKDLPNTDKRAKFEFYLQNVALMAGTKNTSARNYNRLRAAEKREKIKWAHIYPKTISTRTSAPVAKGGALSWGVHLKKP